VQSINYLEIHFWFYNFQVLSACLALLGALTCVFFHHNSYPFFNRTAP